MGRKCALCPPRHFSPKRSALRWTLRLHSSITSPISRTQRPISAHCRGGMAKRTNRVPWGVALVGRWHWPCHRPMAHRFIWLFASSAQHLFCWPFRALFTFPSFALLATQTFVLPPPPNHKKCLFHFPLFSHFAYFNYIFYILRMNLKGEIFSPFDLILDNFNNCFWKDFLNWSADDLFALFFLFAPINSFFRLL